MVASVVGRSRGLPWSEQDVWLIIYPDQFGASGLSGVAEVAAALMPEINGVHLLPFHPSSSDGGFSVEDYARVDSAFGSWTDVETIGASGRLMADAVINHVSAQGAWFRSHLAGEPGVADFFRVVPDGTDLGAVARPRPGSPVTRFTRADGSSAQYWTTFSPDQVDLDYRSPEVLLAVCEAIFRYVAAGASAIRLDAIAFIGKDPATTSMHRPETHTVVALIRDCLHEIDPGVVLITETNVPHQDNIAYLGPTARPEAHAVYQFTLAPLVLHAVQTGDVVPLIAWAAQLETSPGTTVLNFLASHDGVGVRPAHGWLSPDQIEALADRCREAGGEVNEAATASGTEPYELAATWRALCEVGMGAPFTPDQLAARHLATHAVSLALAGIPLLYSHSLAASPNANDRRNRTGIARDLNRGRFDSSAAFLGLLASDVVARRVWPRLREMLRWRQASPAFHPDALQRVVEAPPGVVAIEREGGGDLVLIVTNLGGSAATLELGPGWRPMADAGSVIEHLEIGPWESSWLKRAPETGVASAR